MTENATPETDVETRLPRPRIRAGAVIWGLLLVAVAAGVLWTASSPIRLADARDAILGIDGFGWTIVGVIAVGTTLTLIALATVVRRLQRHLARRAPRSSS